MGGRGLQGFVQMGTGSALAVLVWPSAEVSCLEEWTCFGYVSACSDAGDGVEVGRSWTESLVSVA